MKTKITLGISSIAIFDIGVGLYFLFASIDIYLHPSEFVVTPPAFNSTIFSLIALSFIGLGIFTYKESLAAQIANVALYSFLALICIIGILVLSVDGFFVSKSFDSGGNGIIYYLLFSIYFVLAIIYLLLRIKINNTQKKSINKSRGNK